ncbi:glycoside hydrolase N-terminal domain-containing protein [Nonomuraea sp. NEAU-A123]|uniref:glycoside hydrolase N-terminal domain-containing protein n=1 Tax=Nonomuraea sp. NEAU-A123 TaxID=2839649 RepID=UPI001BE40936|nr:glycoside hydrolase N-terminal domain-containing protein [Nonomuraea sp. NEAU-A123]MBT2225910.1 glycoside hydrolase N-terminal domain-containing protein [Nonomuraea sp. NEAU-A123]
MPEHRIYDTEPGLTWEDAFLSGNGEYGIMVYGEPHAQRVVFDHHRFVLPNGTRDLRPPAIADRLGEIRELILSGRAAEAQSVLRSPVDQRVTLIHRASGYREEIELVAGEPHQVAL